MYEYHTNRRSQRDLYTRIVDRQPSSPLTIGALLNSSLATNLWPRGGMALSLSLSLTNLPLPLLPLLKWRSNGLVGNGAKTGNDTSVDTGYRHRCFSILIDSIRRAREIISQQKKNYNITFFFLHFCIFAFFSKSIDRLCRSSDSSIPKLISKMPITHPSE